MPFLASVLSAPGHGKKLDGSRLTLNELISYSVRTARDLGKSTQIVSVTRQGREVTFTLANSRRLLACSRILDNQTQLLNLGDKLVRWWVGRWGVA